MVGTILRIIIILTGVFLLAETVSSLARRKMTESFCLIWGLASIIFILSGIFLRPYGLNQFISSTGLVFILIVGFCVISGAYYISVRISELARKNQELAMQVTLMKRENEEIMDKLNALQEQIKAEAQVGV